MNRRDLGVCGTWRRKVSLRDRYARDDRDEVERTSRDIGFGGLRHQIMEDGGQPRPAFLALFSSSWDNLDGPRTHTLAACASTSL
jgi:hypothetical protein